MTILAAPDALKAGRDAFGPMDAQGAAVAAVAGMQRLVQITGP